MSERMMRNEVRIIYVECKHDFKLVDVLGIPKKKIKHVAGKGNVCRVLKKKGNSVGMVDEDPDCPQPSYLKELQMVEESHGIKILSHGIKILSDNRSHNLLILLCPNLEAWILEAAKEAGIDICNYNLPNNASELHEVININIEKLKGLLRNLSDKSDRMRELRRIFIGV